MKTPVQEVIDGIEGMKRENRFGPITLHIIDSIIQIAESKKFKEEAFMWAVWKASQRSQEDGQGQSFDTFYEKFNVNK
jgi:hypothetical protein